MSSRPSWLSRLWTALLQHIIRSRECADVSFASSLAMSLKAIAMAVSTEWGRCRRAQPCRGARPQQRRAQPRGETTRADPSPSPTSERRRLTANAQRWPVAAIDKPKIGFVACLVNEEAELDEDGQGKAKIRGNIIHWSSTKCKRITRYVLASEIYAMTAGVDLAIVLKTTLTTVADRLDCPRIPLVVLTDSRSLYDCLVK